MGGKTKTTQQSNSTSTAAPPSWTMPGIQTASDQVIAALGQRPDAYTGDFVAGVNNQPAIDAYTGAAGSAGGWADWLTPKVQGWENPTNDAQMSAAITGKANEVTENLLRQVLPGLRSSALDAGAYSGDRAMAILPQLALDDATQNISNISADYVYQNAQQNANRELEYMSQLPALVDTAMRMRTSQGDILSQAAALDQQQKQAGLDNSIARHDYSVKQPYEGLDIASALLAQLSGNYGTQTNAGTQTTTQQTSGLGPIVQGLMGAAGMALGLPMGGGGTLAGSLFGARAPGAAASSMPTRNIFPS